MPSTTPRKRPPTARRGGNDGSGTSTSFWHRLGNDRVVADAFNDGYVELWDGERQYRSSDYYDAGAQQFAGGFGYLRVGRTAWSTLYVDRPPKSAYRRTFGMGYYEKEEQANGLHASQAIFAPFGTDPVVLSQLVLRNTTARAETAHYVEYWGVNPEVVPPGFTSSGPSVPQPPRSAEYLPGLRTLAALPPRGESPVPHELFLSSLTDPVAGRTLSDRTDGAGRQAMFAMGATVGWLQGRRTPLCTPMDIATRRRPRRWSPACRRERGRRWRPANPPGVSRCPGLPCPESPGWPGRPRGITTTCAARKPTRTPGTRRSSTRDTPTSTTGGWTSLTGTFCRRRCRWLSWPRTSPARLWFSGRAQPSSGDIPYGFVSATAFDLDQGYRADDADLWLLWATRQYVLVTRDLAFLNQRKPFLGSRRSGTVQQHLELAFRHQLSAGAAESTQ